MNWLFLHNILYKVVAERRKQTLYEMVTIRSMLSPAVLGSLPMAHKRQSTSSIVLTASPPLFFSGSLVMSVTSRPLADFLTDLTCVFLHNSIPEFSISVVQFALIKLSKFLNTCIVWYGIEKGCTILCENQVFKSKKGFAHCV